MKISNSKKELARIISENGGWRDGEFAAQNVNGDVRGFDGKPKWMSALGLWRCDSEHYQWFWRDENIANYHQATISRAEYFHLYPAPDADGWIEHDGKHEPEISTSGLTIWCKWSDGLEQSHEANMVDWIDDSGVRVVAYRLHKQEQAKTQFCESVMRSIPEPDEQVWTNPPTIEQLAADYRNAKDYAERKQQEADDAKSDADSKLKALELAGESLGLLVSLITAKQDQELAVAMAPPKAQNHIDDNSTEADLLRQALIDAATSLETIHVHSYGADSFLDSKEQMRIFAESRAKVAREALGLSVTPITTR